MPRIPVGDWVADLVDFLRTHLGWLFDFVNSVVGGLVHGLEHLLTGPPVLVVAAVFAIIGWALRGLLFGVLTLVGFCLVDSLDKWDPAMSTLALVLVSAAAAVLVAVPLGILAARNRTFGAVLKPVLDLMQTMPALVYLIPAIFFFGIGEVPGVIATMVFALPPGVRLTELGIRGVDPEMVEAGEAFGTSDWRILRDIQLPLALPTIMAGINQIIMLSLSMVVTAGIVGAGGLGEVVYSGITRLDVGLGFEAGLAVVVIAIYLDRATAAAGTLVEARARRAAKERSTSRLSVLNWRPRPLAAFSGVVVAALVGALITGSSGNDRTVTIGWIPWDEDIVVTQTYKKLLEDEGYKVKLVQLDVGPLFTGLSQGKVDLFLDAWLPEMHGEYLRRYQGDIEQLGTWYDKADIQLAVPAWTPYRTVDELRGHGSEFNNRIVGIEAGASMTELTADRLIPEYGLGGEYKLQTSSTPAMLAELDRAMSSHQPIVVTLWRPHWAYSKYDLRPLPDPKKAYGDPGYISALGRRNFARDFPELNTWVRNFHLDDATLGDMEKTVLVDYKGKPPEQGVAAYLKAHPEVRQKFLAAAPGGADGAPAPSSPGAPADGQPAAVVTREGTG